MSVKMLSGITVLLLTIALSILQTNGTICHKGIQLKTHLNHTVRIPVTLNETVTFNLKKNEYKRLFFTVDKYGPLTINVSSNDESDFIAKTIFHNNREKWKSEDNQINIPSINFACVSPGDYDLFLLSTSSLPIKAIIQDRHPSDKWPFRNKIRQSKIRIVQKAKKSFLIKWEKSKLDIHAMTYCIVINSRASITNLCEAYHKSNENNQVECNNSRTYQEETSHITRFVQLRPNETQIICTGLKNHHTFTNIKFNQMYVFDVFGIHRNLHEASFHLGTRIFRRRKVIELPENKLTYVNLSNPVITTSLVYTPKRYKNWFYIIPCRLPIELTLYHRFKGKQKREIANKLTIYKPTIISQRLQPHHSVLLKLKQFKVDEFDHFTNKIGVIGMGKLKFDVLPQMPHNTELFQVGKQPSCKSLKIRWFASPDPQQKQYCIYVYNVMENDENYYGLDIPSFCDSDTVIKNHTQFLQMDCFLPLTKSKFEKRIITNLPPGKRIRIQLTVSVKENKLPYKPLDITLPRCNRERA